VWTTSRAHDFASVVELPLDETFSDLAAMIGRDDNWSYYAIGPRSLDARPCTGEPVPIISIHDDSGLL